MKMSDILRQLPEERDTMQFAGKLAKALDSGGFIALSGDLGAGKTTLVRGLMRAFGYAGVVRSPTYSLVESYALDGHTVHHFDLYRFAGPEEWVDAGFDDYFAAGSICLVEWPEMAGALLPKMDLHLSLQIVEHGRILEAHSRTPRGCALLEQIEREES